jgi:hypothetical protein
MEHNIFENVDKDGFVIELEIVENISFGAIIFATESTVCQTDTVKTIVFFEKMQSIDLC